MLLPESHVSRQPHRPPASGPVSLLFRDVYTRDPDESGFVAPGTHVAKMRVDAFDAVLAALLELQRQPVILAPGLVDDRSSFALTVDDGGLSYYTLVADRLESLGWRGHCFVCADMVGTRGFLDRRQIRELDERGHLIGGHLTFTSAVFSARNWNRMFDEWRASRMFLEDLLGHAVTVASVRGGFVSSRAAYRAAQSGLALLFTSEPYPSVRTRGGCALAGRFAVHRASQPALTTAALASLVPSVIRREWAVWSAKQLLKPLLGAAYPRLGLWWASHAAGGQRRSTQE